MYVPVISAETKEAIKSDKMCYGKLGCKVHQQFIFFNILILVNLCLFSINYVM